MENFKTSSARAYLAAIGGKSSAGPSSALTNSSESLLSAIVDGIHPKLVQVKRNVYNRHACVQKWTAIKIFVGP